MLYLVYDDKNLFLHREKHKNILCMLYLVYDGLIRNYVYTERIIKYPIYVICIVYDGKIRSYVYTERSIRISYVCYM